MNLPEFLVDQPDGEIRLAGHRIGLYHVVFRHQDGSSPERLHEEFPSLPLPLIRRVLEFYRANRAEVDAYVADYEAELRRQEAETPPSPALLESRRKLEEARRAPPL